jgi:hypothetical protein
MIVNSHDPDHCVFHGDAEREALVGALRRLDGVAGDHGVAPQGVWMARVAHEVYALVDAPNAHAVEEAIIAAGLPGITRSRVIPVMAAADVVGAE